MSLRTRYHTSGRSWAVRLNDGALLPPVLPPIPDLEISQKFALLYLRKGGVDSLSHKVVETMRAMGIRFTKADMLALAEHGYARRVSVPSKYAAPFGIREMHTLTPSGLSKVETIARELAQKYKLHHVTFHRAVRGSNRGPSVGCICGWNTYASRGNEGVLIESSNRHLAHVASGTWKPPRPVVEFLNEYAPLKLPLVFSGTTNSRPSGSTLVSESGAAGPDVRPAAPVNSESRYAD